MTIITVGMDLAKTAFAIHGVDESDTGQTQSSTRPVIAAD